MARVGQRPPLAALIDEEPKQLLRGESAIVLVAEYGRHRRLDLPGIGGGIQIDQRGGRAHALRAFEHSEAAGVGKRDGGDRDDRGQDQDETEAIRLPGAAFDELMIPLRRGGVGYAHCAAP